MIAYSKDQFMADFMVLGSCARVALDEIGALASCACCGARAHGAIGAESEGCGVVMALCKTCIDNHAAAEPQRIAISDWLMASDSFFGVPSTSDDRRKVIEMFRRTVIHSLAEQKVLPAVMRMLELDHAISPSLPRDALGLVVRQSGKRVRAFRCPVPWYDSDPFIVGGKFAQDAAALVKSLQSGKTKGYSFMGGPMIFTSSDNSLVKEWGKP